MLVKSMRVFLGLTNFFSADVFLIIYNLSVAVELFSVSFLNGANNVQLKCMCVVITHFLNHICIRRR